MALPTGVAWEAEHAKPALGTKAVVYSGRAVMLYPAKVAWQARHTACDPDSTGDLDSIPTNRLMWADLVEWTGHMMEKPWRAHTDWAQLIRDVAAAESELIVPVNRPTLNA
ncbi:hypothetical protein ACGF13_28325 [Kitasatospora sp. NPDC048286]|uniref:hypothetical protein n=1 Tax=Kitasatospora sp. NPDC048286 TaxID=3364047 RepID=UPI0037231600